MLVYVRPSNEALLRARVPGAQEQRGCPSNPFYCGGSASKKNGLPASSHHSEAARCGTKGNLAALLSLLCSPRSWLSEPAMVFRQQYVERLAGQETEIYSPENLLHSCLPTPVPRRGFGFPFGTRLESYFAHADRRHSGFVEAADSAQEYGQVQRCSRHQSPHRYKEATSCPRASSVR